PAGEPGTDIAGRLERAVREAGVNVLTDTDLVSVDGYVGAFSYALRDGKGEPVEGVTSVIVLAVGTETYEPEVGEFGWGAT
ncbi:MAG: hypothetical protein GWN18_18870, partial [Thermoplasmata archaeon]|nr:hypothetical protein [Thermoplasmata archaeon]NIS10979.1 hypothetical protein [Thermoplasmata archaeon]NIS22030.1 hypothetical protein [Thermoplasmata archaeon]NIT79889.1 hypothetical protein [Thermoplasmata archaeon]NIU51054.1 hypothetical protein [Thermoplasmata archaeon]